MGRSATVIDAVEAIYTGLSSVTPSDWLRHALTRILACVPGNAGGFAYAYDIGGPPRSWAISRPIVQGAPLAMGRHIEASFADASPEQRVSVLPRLGPSGTYSATTGQLLTAYGAGTAERLGVLDAIHVNGLDADDTGVLVAVAIPEPRRLLPAERRRFAMLAAHLSSARRLLSSARGRRSLSPVSIFETNGAVAHLEPAHERFVDVLRSGLLRVEKARRRRDAHEDADTVLEAWRALVAGRYSLVEKFDTDGRRYVLAYENPPNVRDPRGLTSTEAAISSWARRGHSHKLIAYELGLSIGTVSGMLARAFHKLGVRSHAELVARLTEPTRLTRSSVGNAELVLFSSPMKPKASERLAGLSRAERDVAKRAIAGMSNAAIARARQTSVSTVSNQLASVFRRLGVRSRAELTALAHGER